MVGGQITICGSRVFLGAKNVFLGHFRLIWTKKIFLDFLTI